MKVAISAQGATLDSPMDPRFGRARCFLLVDSESLAFCAHDNAVNLNAVQGAGIQAAQAVARLGSEAVITGHVGPKALATLEAAGIPVYLVASGTVREAIEAFRAGRLARASQANVQGHWA